MVTITRPKTKKEKLTEMRMDYSVLYDKKKEIIGKMKDMRAQIKAVKATKVQ